MKKAMTLALFAAALFTLSACRQPDMRTLPFTNLSEEYHVDDGELAVYYPEGNLPYADVESFFALIDGAIDFDKLSFTYSDATLNISYTHERSDFEDAVELSLELDSATDTATVNRGEFFTAFATQTATDFGEGLTTVDVTENTPTSQTLDFGAYNFSIRQEDENFLIPLHLANLLFTGSMFDVYYNGDDLYGVDTYQIRSSDIQRRLHSSTRNYARMPSDIKEATYDYLLFSFDHFYGLRDVESYAGRFSGFEDDIMGSIDSHYRAISRLAYSLDDLHTSHVMGGYYARSRNVPLARDDLGSDTLEHLSRQDEMESYCALDERTYLGEGIARVKIDRFDATTPSRFEGHLEILQSQDNIDAVLIDLSCNRGGILGTMMQLLGYMSEDPIRTHRLNTFDNHQRTRTIENDREPFDFEFVFLSSAITYSAGNHMLAIAREMGFPIVGEPSRGGAASIKTNIVPSGSVLLMSSTSLLTDQDFESLEDGVDVDVFLDWQHFDDETTLIEILKNLSD